MIDDNADLGEVTYTDSEAVIKFERHLPALPAVVWVAITDPDFLSKWWGEVTIDPQLGGQFNVCWYNVTPDGDRFTMHAKITEFDPPHVLETTGDAHGTLRWELIPEGGGTTLVFTSTLELSEEYRTLTLAGWHFHLMALARAFAGETADLVALPEWNDIHERYVQIGP